MAELPILPADALYLIDTMGYIFRAFHALPPLSNSRGTPTQAVLGFTTMLRKLLQDGKPRAVVAAFDLAGPTFREKDFASYKANRPAMPESLGTQIPYIRRSLEAHRVPILEMEGYEADDIIGTVARRAATAGLEVVIVSSDKDLLQLVSDRVRVFNPGKNQLLDSAAVESFLGVTPKQVVDLLALRGDAIDNIPGAPGIGEKGSQDLIRRFGSVEAALEHADEVERKTYRESLQQNRDQILLSKSLATIHTEVPLQCQPDAWLRQEPDLEACRALFAELEFNHLLKAIIAAAASSPSAASGEPSPPVLSGMGLPASVFATAQSLEELFRQSKSLGLAISGEQVQFGLAYSSEAAADATVVIVAGRDLLPLLSNALGDPERSWQWHDTKQVLAALRRLEIPPPSALPERTADVGLLAYLADSTQSGYDLRSIAKRRWGSEAPAASDLGQTALLCARLAPELTATVQTTQQWSVYADIDLPLLPVLDAMEAAGVRLDPSQLASLSLDLEFRCATHQRRIHELAGASFNINSPKQLGEVLFEKMALPQPQRRGKTKALSTAVDVLEDLSEHEIAREVLEYRQLSKLKSTYVDALPPLIDPVTRRIHTTFVLAGSATGRLASHNPNLQNIPVRSEVGRQIRAAFQAEPGRALVSADYSQIELRLLAHFSEDPLLLDAYRSNADIHRLTAAEVFGIPPLAITSEHRRRAKAVNFGIVYGLSAYGLARQLGIPQAEAAKFIRRYFERYAGVQGFIQRTLEQARKDNSVRTLFGRMRPIPNLNERNPTLRGFAERTAINTPLQGTAADLIKLAMIRLQPRLASLGASLLLQVHDELVLEVESSRVHELAEVVRETMEKVYSLRVPLVVEVGAGPNWRDLEQLPRS